MHRSPRSSCQPVDGGLLSFSEEEGSYVLLRGPSFAANRRVAPRVLQVGLLTPCNLKCHFCYRDAAAPSRLTPEFLVPLLQDAARWGVLEVAFGGGEPLLFRGLVPMLAELRETTALGLNLTTNGVLLSDERIAELDGLIGELRISAYDDNDYRATLERTRGLRTGLNLLVTPANIGRLEALVHEALDCGADNVLLLGYKGPDPAMHLGAAELGRLRDAVTHMQALRLRLDICWYPALADLPHLFPRSDCDAGDDFLVITPDRAVQACSFSARKYPFETFAQLQQIYRALRAERPCAQVEGCTRGRFPALRAPAPEQDTLWRWEARASNNSADWTLIAEFSSPRKASRAAAILNVFFRDVHEYFRQWSRDNGKNEDTFWAARAHHEGVLPPPVQAFVDDYQLDVTSYDHGISDGTDEPSIVALGKQLLMHHPYCLALDRDFLRAFFERVGGGGTTMQVYVLDYSFLMKASATGYHEEVELQLLDYFTDPYGEVMSDSPPWTRELGEWIDVEVDFRPDAHQSLEIDASGLRLECVLDRDVAAGCEQLERWLEAHGYRDIHIELSVLE